MGLHKQNMASVMSMPPGFRASRAVPALPSSLAGLVAWGEGSDLGVDGTAISSWLNKTNSGLDPAQATGANQPTVKANAINGQKAVEFTAASSQFLAFPAGALGWFQNVAGGTLVMVFQPKTLAATQRPLYVQINGGTAARIQVSTTTTPQFVASGRSTDAGTTANALGGTPAVLTPSIVCGIVSFSGGMVTLLANGATAATNALAPAQNTDNTASAGIGIGAIATTGVNPADGYLAAYAMWNVAYSRSQLSGVLNRWSQLYGIPLSG